MFPIINTFKCDGCGICIKRCPAQIMGLINGKAAYLQVLCEECGICAEVCPTNGIYFELPKHYEPVEVHEAYQFKR
jgi:NAD-dependent dihydropyrimidine dehydrogenase PreA subunit